MSNGTQAEREMYLAEWVYTLPHGHYARRSYDRLIGAAEDMLDAGPLWRVWCWRRRNRAAAALRDAIREAMWVRPGGGEVDDER